jgi:hypothetical protein
MPAVGGSVLVVYQGGTARRASASAGWWPTVAYRTATAWQASMNGSVPPGRGAVAGLPGPGQLLRVFYRDFDGPPRGVPFDHAHDVRVLLRGDEGQAGPGSGFVPDEETVTGLAPVTEYHRQVKACTAMVSRLP